MLPFWSSHFLFIWDAIFLQSDLKKACMKYLLENNLAVGVDFCFGKLTYIKAKHKVTVN